MKRAVIFGSAGQLGQELVTEFRARGYEVTGFSRRTVDVTDPAAVESSLAAIDPSVVLNAAAYNQVDIAETEPLLAYSANAFAVLRCSAPVYFCDCSSAW